MIRPWSSSLRFFYNVRKQYKFKDDLLRKTSIRAIGEANAAFFLWHVFGKSSDIAYGRIIRVRIDG